VTIFRTTLTVDEALELVGIDGCTEARNGQSQPLDDGRSRMYANPDGTFVVVTGDPRCHGCVALRECERASIHPECR
jgi:hypothetical protein